MCEHACLSMGKRHHVAYMQHLLRPTMTLEPCAPRPKPRNPALFQLLIHEFIRKTSLPYAEQQGKHREGPQRPFPRNPQATQDMCRATWRPLQRPGNNHGQGLRGLPHRHQENVSCQEKDIREWLFCSQLRVGRRRPVRTHERPHKLPLGGKIA